MRNGIGITNKRQWKHDQTGAQDTIDAIIMVAITLVAGTSLVALLGSIDGPTERVNADFSLTTDAGADQAWATGDERIRLKHTGGEAVRSEQVSITLTVGANTQSYAGAALGFSDDTLDVGEEWVYTTNMAIDTKVELEVVTTTDSSASTGAGGVGGGGVTGGSHYQESLFMGSVAARGAVADLVVEITGTSPGAPTSSDTVMFDATITNKGAASTPLGVDIDIAFEVDGGGIGTVTVTGPLAAGASTDTTSAGWSPSGSGIFDAKATVDPTDVIIEGAEGNNEDTHSFSVTGGPFDPGHAYEDEDCDLVFAASDGDTAIDKSDIEDGSYSASSGNCMVWPASISPIELRDCDCNFATFGGGSLVIEADVDVFDADLDIVTSGDFILRNAAFDVGDSGFRIDSGGDVHLSDCSLAIDDVDLDITPQYDLHVIDCTVDIDNTDAGFDAGRHAYLNGTDITTNDVSFELKTGSSMGSGNLVWQEGSMTASNGAPTIDAKDDVDVRGTTFATTQNLLLKSGGISSTFYVDDAIFDDPNDTAKYEPCGATVIGTPAPGYAIDCSG